MTVMSCVVGMHIKKFYHRGLSKSGHMRSKQDVDMTLTLQHSVLSSKRVIQRTHTCCWTSRNIPEAIFDSDISKSLHGHVASRMNRPSNL